MSSELVHSVGPERTLEQRDLEILRPAKENTPRPRAKPVLREVTNGIVCFCGERFSEGQALDFMVHLRAELGEDARRWRLRMRKQAEYERERYRTDAEYRERYKTRKREEARRRYADPERRSLTNQRRRIHRAEHRDEVNAVKRRAWREAHPPQACELCGNEMRSDSRWGVCMRTPECIRENNRRKMRARTVGAST